MEAVMSATIPIGPFSLATETAKEAVLVANTPAFLLERLRRDVSVQTVVSSTSSGEIMETLRTMLVQRITDPNQLVLAYVYLAAMASVIDPTDLQTMNQFSSLDLSNLEWGGAIRALILSEAVPTSTLEVQVAEKPRP
jgi:hypothetical protein